jgi:hypothetical protein
MPPKLGYKLLNSVYFKHSIQWYHINGVHFNGIYMTCILFVNKDNYHTNMEIITQIGDHDAK